MINTARRIFDEHYRECEWRLERNEIIIGHETSLYRAIRITMEDTTIDEFPDIIAYTIFREKVCELFDLIWDPEPYDERWLATPFAEFIEEFRQYVKSDVYKEFGDNRNRLLASYLNSFNEFRILRVK